jgi:hypothetical protein
MHQHSPIPAEPLRWVTERLAGLDGITDVSWPKAQSRVWRVTAGPTTAYLKLSPTAADHRRELRGYRHAERVLAPGSAPRLLAADPGMLALLSSAQPGRVVRGLALGRGEERRLHELAGRTLRRWHDGAEPAPDRSAVRAAVARQATEAATCLERAATQLDTAERALVRCAADELPQLAEAAPVVYRHGDFGTRNWLWHAPSGRLGLIDFELADHGLVAEEYVWLHGALWLTRPDLAGAYFTGYGRPLSPVEERLLHLLTARLAVSYLTTGLTDGNPVLVTRGRLALHRLVHPG